MKRLAFIVFALGVASFGWTQRPPTQEELRKDNERRNQQVANALRRDPVQEALWRNQTRLTPSALAKRAGDATRNLKNAEGALTFSAQTAEGRGQSAGVLRVRDRQNYRFDFWNLALIPFSNSVAANGKTKSLRRREQTFFNLPLQRPLQEVSRFPDPSAIFFEQHSRLLFQGLTDGRDAWGPLIQGLSKRMKLRVQERTMNFQGRSIQSYRLVGERGGARPERIEIVVDGQFWLPVTVRTERVDGNKKRWESRWTAAYRFGVQFRPQDFTLQPS